MSGLPDHPVVLPSLMSADMLRLGEQLGGLIAAGTSAVHVDVMDLHFVPNLTVGPDFTRAIAGPVHEAGGTVDVHLMVGRPAEAIGLFAPYADAITVHVEADPVSYTHLTLPHRHGTDGFFIARLRRPESS